MINKFCFLLVFTLLIVQNISSTELKELKVNYKISPIGLDAHLPTFSWIIKSDLYDVEQFAYRIYVSDHINFDKTNIVWNSNKILSNNTYGIKYDGLKLKSNQKYYWKLEVWLNHDNQKPIRNESNWVTGFLSSNDWHSKWITQSETDNKQRKIPYFRKRFQILKKIKNARLYISSKGMYECKINNKRTGDGYFTPGWTSYDNRIQYQVYDVKKDLIKNNVISISVGHGWYRGNLVWKDKQDHYGSRQSIIAQLMIDYEDGTSDIMTTDKSWKYGLGPIAFSEIYHGEVYDARLEDKKWFDYSCSSAGLKNVIIDKETDFLLKGTENELVRKQEEFKPKLIKTSAGENILDFGQNLVGWVEFTTNNTKSNDTIVIKHAEILDKHGNFYTENLRSAKQTNTYITNGNPDKVYHPHFTFQGFRYALIEGLEKVDPNQFTAVALYSDMVETGSFETSNELVNQLQKNIVWSQKGNFIDIPTDCPQRDERLGWTGDAQVFFNTASFNMDVRLFFKKWLKDLNFEQKKDGAVPYIIPNVLGSDAYASAGWADAATIIPWNHYLKYGDKQILTQQYQSMKNWVNYIVNHSDDYLWQDGFHFGDWLFYRPEDDNDGMSAVTDKYLIAQCFFARSTQILLESAKVLEIKEDITYYKSLLENVKNAFHEEYLTSNGMLVSNTQTAYVLALQFDLIPEKLIDNVVNRLTKNIKKYNTHLTTGFLGTPYLNSVLSKYGKDDIAIDLLLQESYPSWLYPVKKGATTIWERWDGIKPDGSTQTPNMNSYNHYAYGAIGEWMYANILGLKTKKEHPGYSEFIINPLVSKAFSMAKGSYKSPNGIIDIEWYNSSKLYDLKIEVPVNSKAEIVLPYKSSYFFSINKEIKQFNPYENKINQQKQISFRLGSGRYNIKINKL